MLIIRVQPQEGIALRFSAKVPGERYRPRTVSMDFRYGSTFGAGWRKSHAKRFKPASFVSTGGGANQ